MPHPPFRSLRSEEHTSELQSQSNLVCRLLLEKKKHSITVGHGPLSATVPAGTSPIAGALVTPRVSRTRYGGPTHPSFPRPGRTHPTQTISSHCDVASSRKREWYYRWSVSGDDVVW